MPTRKNSFLFAATVCVMFGQSAAVPRFEAASIKLNPSLSLRHVILPPTAGRLSTRSASLRLLIQTAYSVQTFQVSGGPDWMNSAGYDLDAKAEGTPSRSQIWLMLQSLLEDRFKLKVHRETKELPVYALTAAKGGLKLSKPRGECVAIDALPLPLERGQQPPMRCGDLMVGAEKSMLFLRGKQITMAVLTKELSTILERPVIDRTGVAEKFDISVDFAWDEVVIGLPKPRQAGDSTEPAGPSIMVALQQQLGLKLESTKGLVEVLVIDHVERPSEN
jgi:uncharacterized protein (TIGR03435 family)